METYWRVIDSNGKVVGNLPTPRLIDEGGGEAWEDSPGHWRLRDDAWDATRKPADMPYTRVRVAHAQDHRVEFTITVQDADGKPYTYEDYWVAVAVTSNEAEGLAVSAMRADIERQWGDEKPVIRIDRIRPGVGIFG